MENYTNDDLLRLFLKFFGTLGAGTAGSQDIVTNSEDYEAPDGSKEFVWAIEVYTDGGTFDELKEGGDNLPALRRTMDGEGYPQGAVLVGRFTKVQPASGTRVAVYKRL